MISTDDKIVFFPNSMKYLSGIYVREYKSVPTGSYQDKLNFILDWFNMYLNCFKVNEDSKVNFGFDDEITKPFEFLSLDKRLEVLFDKSIFSDYNLYIGIHLEDFRMLIEYESPKKSSIFQLLVSKKK